MTSLVTVKREVEELKQRIIPPKDIWICTVLTWDKSQPHGKYGGQCLKMGTHECKAMSDEEEMSLLKEIYAGIPKKVRKRTDYWDSWDHFLEHSKCDCGKHES